MSRALAARAETLPVSARRSVVKYAEFLPEAEALAVDLASGLAAPVLAVLRRDALLDGVVAPVPRPCVAVLALGADLPAALDDVEGVLRPRDL